MSRDFILVLGGGVVALVTTFVVLFIMDWVYRRDAMANADKTIKVKSEAVKPPALTRAEPVSAKPPMPAKTENASPKPITATKTVTVSPPAPVPPKAEPAPPPVPVPAARLVENPRPAPKPEPIHQDFLPPPETMLKSPLNEDNAA
jgi:hypothetical protein